MVKTRSHLLKKSATRTECWITFQRRNLLHYVRNCTEKVFKNLEIVKWSETKSMRLKKNSKFIFAHSPVSCYWSFSMSSENIRKPELFLTILSHRSLSIPPETFRKIHRKTAVSESLFKKVPGCNFIKRVPVQIQQ